MERNEPVFTNIKFVTSTRLHRETVSVSVNFSTPSLNQSTTISSKASAPRSCFRLDFNSSSFQAYLEKMSSDKSFSCSFITCNIAMGRLGNQLFQIASILGTARRNDLIPVIPKSMSATQFFDFPNVLNFTIKNRKGLFYPKCCEYDKRVESLDRSKNWTLSGYLQSWRYFSDSKDTVYQSLKIKDEYLSSSRQFLRNVSKDGVLNICFHVRRGDMVTKRAAGLGYTTVSAEYLTRAMDVYTKKFSKVQFLIISDDIKWCRENIKRNVTFSPFVKPIEDLATMSLCDHVSVTSGSFGWWGAFLSKGTTVYNFDFPRNNTYLGNATNRADYYPNGWIGLS